MEQFLTHDVIEPTKTDRTKVAWYRQVNLMEEKIHEDVLKAYNWKCGMSKGAFLQAPMVADDVYCLLSKEFVEVLVKKKPE